MIHACFVHCFAPQATHRFETDAGLNSYLAKLFISSGNEQIWPLIDKVQIWADIEFLRGITLIDSPGLGDINDARFSTPRSAICKLDHFIVVVDANRASSETIANTLILNSMGKRILRSHHIRNQQPFLSIVVTRIDIMANTNKKEMEQETDETHLEMRIRTADRTIGDLRSRLAAVEKANLGKVSGTASTKISEEEMMRAALRDAYADRAPWIDDLKAVRTTRLTQVIAAEMATFKFEMQEHFEKGIKRAQDNLCKRSHCLCK